MDSDIDLSSRMRELRDTSDPGIPPGTTDRRANRIRVMQQRQAYYTDLLAEIDRYREALQSMPNPCLTDHVPAATMAYLDKTRARIERQIAQIRADIDTLRKATW